MANPTSSPSLASSILWEAAAYMTNSLMERAEKIPSILAYHGPKMAFETSVYIAKLGGRSVYYLGSTAAGWVKPDFVNITTPQIFEDIYNNAADKAAHLADQATVWVTGQPICQILEQAINIEPIWHQNSTPMDGNFTSGPMVGNFTGGLGEQFTNGTSWADKTVEPVASCSNSTFQATELTAPIMALAFCTNRCSKNLFEALHHAKLLVTGIRKVSTSYTIPTINSRSPTTITKAKTYTTPQLLKDIVMEVGFAALWGFGAYSAYEGIYDHVLDAAGGNAEHALSVVRKIAFASGAAPFAYEWIKEALYAPASTNDNVSAAPAAAGATRYSHAAAVPQFSAYENMPFEDDMEVLTKRDASIEIDV